MVPKCRAFRVRVLDDSGSEVERFEFPTINVNMARLIVRLDYPRTWGKRLVISAVR